MGWFKKKYGQELGNETEAMMLTREIQEHRRKKQKKAQRKVVDPKIKEATNQKRKHAKKGLENIELIFKKGDGKIHIDQCGDAKIYRPKLNDDPAYGGVVRNCLRDLPPDTDQDTLDDTLVRGVADEMNWLLIDEEQMLPRYEHMDWKEAWARSLQNRKHDKLVEEFNTWNSYRMVYNGAAMADIIVTKHEGTLPVPYIGADDDRDMLKNVRAATANKVRDPTVAGMTRAETQDNDSMRTTVTIGNE